MLAGLNISHSFSWTTVCLVQIIKSTTDAIFVIQDISQKVQ